MLLVNLKNKDYRLKLADVMEKLVVARQSYLHHLDENWQTFLDKLQEAFLFFEEKAPVRSISLVSLTPSAQRDQRRPPPERTFQGFADQ